MNMKNMKKILFVMLAALAVTLVSGCATMRAGTDYVAVAAASPTDLPDGWGENETDEAVHEIDGSGDWQQAKQELFDYMLRTRSSDFFRLYDFDGNGIPEILTRRIADDWSGADYVLHRFVGGEYHAFEIVRNTSAVFFSNGLGEIILAEGHPDSLPGIMRLVRFNITDGGIEMEAFTDWTENVYRSFPEYFADLHHLDWQLDFEAALIGLGPVPYVVESAPPAVEWDYVNPMPPHPNEPVGPWMPFSPPFSFVWSPPEYIGAEYIGAFTADGRIATVHPYGWTDFYNAVRRAVEAEWGDQLDIMLGWNTLFINGNTFTVNIALYGNSTGERVYLLHTVGVIFEQVLEGDEIVYRLTRLAIIEASTPHIIVVPTPEPVPPMMPENSHHIYSFIGWNSSFDVIRSSDVLLPQVNMLHALIRTLRLAMTLDGTMRVDEVFPMTDDGYWRLIPVAMAEYTMLMLYGTVAHDEFFVYNDEYFRLPESFGGDGDSMFFEINWDSWVMRDNIHTVDVVFFDDPNPDMCTEMHVFNYTFEQVLYRGQLVNYRFIRAERIR